MSVDKFGRSHKQKLKKNRDLSSSFTSTFLLTANGDYDFLNRRLTNANQPSENNDVINKLYFDNNLNKVKKEILNEVRKEIENASKKLENMLLRAINALSRKVLTLEEKSKEKK